MKPHICSICGKDFRRDVYSDGAVTFTNTAKPETKKDGATRTGRVLGSHQDAHWFCDKHLPIALKYQRCYAPHTSRRKWNYL